MNKRIKEKMQTIYNGCFGNGQEQLEEVSKYINQLEADKLEMAKGYIELAENSDYNHDVFILAKEYIKEVEK